MSDHAETTKESIAFIVQKNRGILASLCRDMECAIGLVPYNSFMKLLRTFGIFVKKSVGTIK
jgi:hypothetical protein